MRPLFSISDKKEIKKRKMPGSRAQCKFPASARKHSVLTTTKMACTSMRKVSLFARNYQPRRRRNCPRPIQAGVLHSFSPIRLGGHNTWTTDIAQWFGTKVRLFSTGLTK